jgi:gluconolactonase
MAPPTNFIWMRKARLEFHRDSVRGPYLVEPQEVNVEVLRLDPAIDAIVPPNPKIFKRAEGFQFTEAPVWVRADGKTLYLCARSTLYRMKLDVAGVRP